MPPSVLRSRFFWRLFAGYVLLVLLGTVLVGVVVETRVQRDLLERMTDSLRSETFYLAQIARDIFAGNEAPEIRHRILESSQRGGSRITILDRDGTVLVDSLRTDPDGAVTPDNLIQRPEIRRCRAEISAVERRFSITEGRECLFAALRVPFGGGEPDGYVRASQPTAPIAARVTRLRETVLAGAAAALVAGLLAGLMFARRVTGPLAAMTSAVESMALGGYGHVAVSNDSDEIGRLADAFNDMSDQLRDRMAIINSDRANLLSILTSMVEGLIATDRDLRIVHLNVVAGRLLGVRPEACAGQPVRAVLPHPALWEIIERAGQAPYDAETREEVEIEGHLLEVRASPMRDAQSSRAGALLVLNDVTELRQLERMRQDFVVNASHELKTPMTSILGYVETLLDDAEIPPATARRFLEKIRTHSLRQRKLVADLLHLAQIESPDTGRERTPLDLRGPVREAVIRHSAACADLQLALSADVPDEPVRVLANAEDLRQILDNLVGNATKYTPAGGRIRVALEVTDGWATVAVEDTGIGIEPQDAERVFERFYRVDKARSRELGGTGLGLSIVKHLTLALGGTASVASEPDKGSTFRVRLPRHRPQWDTGDA